MLPHISFVCFGIRVQPNNGPFARFCSLLFLIIWVQVILKVCPLFFKALSNISFVADIYINVCVLKNGVRDYSFGGEANSPILSMTMSYIASVDGSLYFLSI